MKVPGQRRTLFAQGVLLLMFVSTLYCYAMKAPDILNAGLDENGLMPLAETITSLASGAGLQPCDLVAFASDQKGIVHDSTLMVAIYAMTPAVLRRKHETDMVLVFYEHGEPEELLPGDEWSLVEKASDPRSPKRSLALMRRDGR